MAKLQKYESPPIDSSDDVKTLVKTYNRIGNLVEKEADAIVGASAKQANKLVAFLDKCEENGLGDVDLINFTKKGLQLAEDRGDSRAYNRMLENITKLKYNVKMQLASAANQAALVVNTLNQQINKTVNPLEVPSENDVEAMEIEAELASREENEVK